MEITISKAEETDFKKISQIEEKHFKDPWSLDTIKSQYKVGNCVIYVAKCGKTVIGYTITTYVCDEIEILRVCIENRYRRKGVATRMFNEVLKYCEEHFLFYINLDVRVSNTEAISLYKKLGFGVVGERKGYYTHYDNENAYLMTKKLLRG